MGVGRAFLTLALAAVLGTGESSKSALLTERVNSGLSSFCNQLSEGWPDVGIPSLDPTDLSLAAAPTELVDLLVTYGQFTSLSAKGFSGIKVDAVKSDVLSLRATAQLNVPSLELTGSRYTLGTFSSEIKDLLIDIGIKFTLSEDDDQLIEVDEIELGFGFSDYDDSLEDAWGSKDIIVAILRATYQPYIEQALKYEIDSSLLGNEDVEDAEFNSPIDDFFDRLFADIRQLILEDHLDPMQLPEDSDDFSVELFNTSVDGTVTVDKGALGGLSTLHRAGNMSATFKPLRTEVVWDGEVGFDDLEIEYTFGLDFPIFGKDLSLSLKMSYVHLSFETDVFIVRQDITLARCNITEFGPVHFKEKGAGPLDTPMYDLLMNTFLGTLHRFVMKAGEEAVCKLLQIALSHV